MQTKRMPKADEAEPQRKSQKVNQIQEACGKYTNVAWCKNPHQ